MPRSSTATEGPADSAPGYEAVDGWIVSPPWAVLKSNVPDPKLEQFCGEKYSLLETSRKRQRMKAPVRFVPHEHASSVYSEADSWKVKRISKQPAGAGGDLRTFAAGSTPTVTTNFGAPRP